MIVELDTPPSFQLVPISTDPARIVTLVGRPCCNASVVYGPAVVSTGDAVSTPENDKPPIERPAVEVEKLAVIVVPTRAPTGPELKRSPRKGSLARNGAPACRSPREATAANRRSVTVSLHQPTLKTMNLSEATVTLAVNAVVDRDPPGAPAVLMLL